MLLSENISAFPFDYPNYKYRKSSIFTFDEYIALFFHEKFIRDIISFIILYNHFNML